MGDSELFYSECRGELILALVTQTDLYHNNIQQVHSTRGPEWDVDFSRIAPYPVDKQAIDEIAKRPFERFPMRSEEIIVNTTFVPSTSIGELLKIAPEGRVQLPSRSWMEPEVARL